MSTFLPGHFGAPGLVSVVAAVAVLGACGSTPAQPRSSAPVGTSSSSAPSTVSIPELQQAVERDLSSGAYSATTNTDTVMNGQSQAQMSGRVNLNGPLTGYLTLRYLDKGKTQVVAEVLTSRTSYVRVLNTAGQASGPWHQNSRDASPDVASYGEYARLLLGQGAGAVKGTEVSGGVQAVHLSGQVTADQVRDIEPSLYDRLRASNVANFACDLWVTPQGRVIRLEQWIEFQGQAVHSTVLLTKFGPPLKVTAPN